MSSPIYIRHFYCSNLFFFSNTSENYKSTPHTALHPLPMPPYPHYIKVYQRFHHTQSTSPYPHSHRTTLTLYLHSNQALWSTVVCKNWTYTGRNKLAGSMPGPQPLTQVYPGSICTSNLCSLKSIFASQTSSLLKFHLCDLKPISVTIITFAA